jgi:Tfp pilus assembly protein FimT
MVSSPGLGSPRGVSRACGTDAGFTITEALIIILFAFLLAAIGVPNLRAAQDGWALQTGAQEVVTKLNEARANALKHNRPAWVVLNGATNTMQVQVLGVPSGSTAAGTLDYLPARVNFVTAATVLLRFDAMGRPIDAAGVVLSQSVQLRHTRSMMTRMVTATTTGRIAVN